MRDKLRLYFQARYPGIAIRTDEELRAMTEITAASKGLHDEVYVWTATDGLVGQKKIESHPDAPLAELAEDDSTDPAVAARWRPADDAKVLYVFKDLQVFNCSTDDPDPTLVRALKELLQWAPEAGCGVVFLGESFTPSPVFSRMVQVLDFALPDAENLDKILRGIEGALDESKMSRPKLGNGERERVIQAALGLSTTEAENAFSLSICEKGAFDPAVIGREKCLAVRRSGMMEYLDELPSIKDIGGLDLLKGFIARSAAAFGRKAREYGLSAPRGILIVGVPGTGKSLSAKAAGSVLGLSTLRFDLGAVFGKYVGESESRIRAALATAEAVAPCVLWIDEVEGGLAGAGGSGDLDSGVAKRVYKTFATWMQERHRPVYLVLTANDVSALPAELLRAGRLDAVFFVDLPSEAEREEILRIHLKRARPKLKIDLGKLVAATKDHTGAEIEEIVRQGILLAAAEDWREPTEKDFLRAAAEVVPLSRTAAERIKSIREWGAARARPASSGTKRPAGVARGTGRMFT